MQVLADHVIERRVLRQGLAGRKQTLSQTFRNIAIKWLALPSVLDFQQLGANDRNDIPVINVGQQTVPNRMDRLILSSHLMRNRAKRRLLSQQSYYWNACPGKAPPGLGASFRLTAAAQPLVEGTRLTGSRTGSSPG